VPSRPLRSNTSTKDFLFVQSTTELGGAEIVLLNLLAGSEELRRRSLVVSLGYGRGDLPRRLAGVGAEVVEMKAPRLRHFWRLVPTYRDLIGLAREAGVRALVANGTHPQAVAGLAARLTGLKSVFWVHSIYREPLLHNDAPDVVALLHRCDLALTVSRAAQEVLGRLRPSVATRLLYNGTPSREVTPDEARAARAELGAGEDDTLIGVFARLQRGKGQDLFIEAARQIAPERPRTRFVVVGGSEVAHEADFLEEMKHAAAAPELRGRLLLTGHRADVARLMAACDVVCHTSRAPESFGMVLIEAMVQARPVIATALGGPGEIIDSPDKGIVIPPDDAGALARAMLALIDDPARRHAMGAAGRAHAQARFSIDVMASTMIRYLDELLAGTGPEPRVTPRASTG